MKPAVLLLLLLSAPPAFAGEIDDARLQLEIVQLRIAREWERVNRVKAEMREVELLVKHEIPPLLAREKELREKLEKLEKKKEKESD